MVICSQRGMLFVSHDFHSEFIATYTKCFPRNKLQTLINLFKCINTSTPLYFNIIISDFCQKGFPFLALRTLSFMHTNEVPFDSYTLCSSLTASSGTKDITFGKQMHAVGGKSGRLSSVFVGSALIDLYSKFSNVKDAALVFNEIPQKNASCVNALLPVYELANAQFYQKVGDKLVAYRKIIVDPAGTGNFTTIQEAINSVPSNNNYWVSIYIKAGIYRKRVTFAEYGCFGPGSNTSQRVSWSMNKLDSMFVEQMANMSFIDSEGWLQNQLF
ncbi:hypothetical protein K1719_037411 [Acacia pycnantha]|nr:hypothetical protein K1719_037411 [Acacia pycnantha]